jgi:hypothetical protein
MAKIKGVRRAWFKRQLPKLIITLQKLLLLALE